LSTSFNAVLNSSSVTVIESILKSGAGKNYKPAKRGDPDRPDPKSWKKAQSLWKKMVAEYEEGQMQREQLMKMHYQLMEIEE